LRPETDGPDRFSSHPARAGASRRRGPAAPLAGADLRLHPPSRWYRV